MDSKRLKSKDGKYSTIDAFSGEHTTSVIVGILFVITLIAFVVLCIAKVQMSQTITTGMIGLLCVLAGFFGGTTIK